MIPTLTVDDLQFEVRWSDQRKTLGLTVDREGELVISAPRGCDEATLRSFVHEKRFWLYTKIAEKEELAASTSRKEFVNGESFPYLGRSHRLLLVDDQESPLKLEGGRFRLRRRDASDGRESFVRWYTEHARPWIEHRLKRFAPRMGVSPSGVLVQDLGFRWGSCGKNDVLNFHWSTILLPGPVVEYVIVHELAHLKHPKHTPEFWLMVERALPDFEQRRSRLASLGSAICTL